MLILADMTQTIPTTASVPSLSLAAISPVMTNLLVGLFLLICIVMILLVLIQRPQGGGLSGAFGSGGGGGAGQTAFGTKTGDVLTWATIGIFVCFVGFAIVLNFATRPPKPQTTTPVVTTPAGTTSPATVGDADEVFDLSGNPLDVLDDQTQDGELPEDVPTDAPTTDSADETGTDLPADDD